MKRGAAVKRFQIRQVMIALSGGAMNVLSNVLAALIASSSLKIMLIILSALIMIAVVYWVVRPQKVSVHIETNPLHNPQDRLVNARRGLIACASLYFPQRGSQGASLTEEQRVERAKAGDYEALDLMHSNLATLIEAVAGHQPALEHCWIITTTSDDEKSKPSSLYVPAVMRYLREQRGVTCQFHVDEYTVALDDDAAVTIKVRSMVDRIFKEAGRLGLSEKQMIADITGGMRSIPMGIILACLDANRDIQYMGTKYVDGSPSGPLFPVLYDFTVDLLD